MHVIQRQLSLRPHLQALANPQAATPPETDEIVQDMRKKLHRLKSLTTQPGITAEIAKKKPKKTTI